MGELKCLQIKDPLLYSFKVNCPILYKKKLRSSNSQNFYIQQCTLRIRFDFHLSYSFPDNSE